jgi:hypothetical protein
LYMTHHGLPIASPMQEEHHSQSTALLFQMTVLPALRTTKLIL